MLNRKIFIGLSLLLIFLSCKKEYSYEGGQYRKCIGCAYLPLCDSSVFIYVDSANTVDTLPGVVSVGNDTTVNGITYSHVTGFAAFPTGLLYNCDGGNYKTILDLAALGINVDSLVQALLQNIPLPIPPGLIQIPKQIKTSFLKTNVAVNGIWTDTIYSLSFPPLLNIFAGLEYKIVEKNVQRTVFQKTYSNVIHVSGKLKFVSTLGNFPIPAYVVDYFFAEDVGIIEIQIRNNNVLTRLTKLWSYQL